MAEEIISTGDLFDEDTRQGAPDEAPEAETRCHEVPSDMHGWRVDRTLAALTPEFSRSYLQQLMGDGAVQLNGSPAQKASAKVKVGDTIQVALRPTQQAMAFVAQPMALDVAYEDDHLMVIVKPAGLVVHPAAGNWSGTLLNGLLAHHSAAASLPRAGIVHRLDKDTSGLMLVGKSRQAVEALVRAIANRDVKREYLAIAHGAWRGHDPVTVDQPIGRDVRNRLRMAVVSAQGSSGKPAKTTIIPKTIAGDHSLVACQLHTGRTHQIRVHLAWLGHPLLGDALYGGKPKFGMARQALHAHRLRLNHPISGAVIGFVSEPPADFSAAAEEAGLHYNPNDTE